MALTGSMRDFGISEILQLIGQQKKSGVLSVQDKYRKVEILLDQGNIVGAKQEPLDPAFDLESMLVSSGLVSRSQMAMAKREQSETLKPLEQIMLSSKAVAKDELESLVALSQLEIIYGLFLWKAGDYSFEPGSVSYPQQWTKPIPSEQVLMDGYRVKDEWPAIEKVLPNGRAILERAPDSAPPSGLSQEQLAVFNMVDGNRTADQIAFLARQVRFETFKLLKELIEADAVSIAGAVAGPVRRDLSKPLLMAGSGLIIVLGLVMLWSGIDANLDRMKGANLTSPGVLAEDVLWAWHAQDRAAAALSVHVLMKGAYPADLEALAGEGELTKAQLMTPLGELGYEMSDGGKSCKVTVPFPGATGG